MAASRTAIPLQLLRGLWLGGGSLHGSGDTAGSCHHAQSPHTLHSILRSSLEHKMTAEDYPLRFIHKVLC